MSLFLKCYWISSFKVMMIRIMGAILISAKHPLVCCNESIFLIVYQGAMNLERVPNEEKLNLCRKYYLGKSVKILMNCVPLYIEHVQFTNIDSILSFFFLCVKSCLYPTGGFAFLPFLWLVNVVWFFKEAFVKPAYTEQPQIKNCEYLTTNSLAYCSAKPSIRRKTTCTC